MLGLVLGERVKIKILLVLLLSFKVFSEDLASLKLSDILLNSQTSSGDIRYYSDVYSQIMNEYQNTYIQLGNRYAQGAINNGLFGGTNMIGWKHANDFSSFKVLFNRSVAPNLFSEEGYIVNDEMVIEIDVSKFIKKLANDEVIKITDQNLLAFGGLVFKRTFRYNHFAATLEDGLQTNFDHLFFIFNYLKADNFHKLSDYDYITKEDTFTLSAGALGTAPVTSYISIGAGVFLSAVKKSKVSLQKLGIEDEKKANENIRLTSEDELSLGSGANVTLLIDVFKLLQLTLFSYDFEYTRSKTYKVYLSVFDRDLADTAKLSEISKVLSFKKFDSSLLAENLTTKEYRQKEIKNSKYLAFLWGGIKNSATEMIEILKDNTVYRFFNHHYEKISYKENLLSKILVALLGKLVGFEQMAARTETTQHDVDINYEAQVNIIDSKEDFNIFDDNILSIDFGYRQRVDSSSKKKLKELKQTISDAVKARSQQIDLYSKYIEVNTLVAPVEFQSAVQLNNKNIEVFMKKNSQDVFSVFKKMCKSKSRSVFSFITSLFNPCQTKLNHSYTTFLKEWTTLNYSGALYNSCSSKYKYSFFMSKAKKLSLISKCMEISNKTNEDFRNKNFPLWRFKDVANNINNYTKSLDYFEELFGEFSNKGQIHLNYKNGLSYKNYFKEGNYKGNILTQFQIDNRLRAPASVE